MKNLQYIFFVLLTFLSFDAFSLDKNTLKMVTEYEQNQARFAKNYRGTGLRGTGIVQYVKAGFIERDSFIVKLSVSGSVIQCWTENYNRISEFNVGQNIKFTGTVDDVVLGELVLRGCEFESVVINEVANNDYEIKDEVSNPTFDCGKSVEISELTVCSDNLLAKTDVENSKQYKRALTIDKIKTNQILSKFYKQRIACKDNKTCIYKSYEESTIAFIKIIKTFNKNDFYSTKKGMPSISIKN